MISRLVVLFLLFPCTVSGQAQEEIWLQYQKATSDSARIELLGSLSNYYIYTQPDSAQYYAQKALEIAYRQDDKQAEVKLLYQLAIIADAHSLHEIASGYILQAKKVAEAIGFQRGVASAISMQGIIEANKGNFTQATEHFLEGLKVFKQIADTSGMINSYIRLGVVNEKNNNWDKALEHYTTARELNATSGSDTNTLLTLYNNIGIIYARKNNLEKAKEYFEEGILLSDTIRYARLHISLLTNMGNTYNHLDNIPQSNYYHNLALEKAIRYNFPEEQARALVNLASNYIKTDLPRSLNYLHESLEITQRLEYVPLQAEIYHTLYDAYKDKGRYKEALEALETHHKISDSLYSLKKDREIATLQAEYELKESKVRIQELKLRNQQTAFQRDIGMAVTGAVVIILLILWISFRKTKTLNKQLKASNQVKDKFFSIIGHDLRGPVGGMVQLLQTLETGTLSRPQEQEIIGELRKQGAASYEVLDNMLNWGMAQLDSLKPEKEVFKTKEIISQNISVHHTQIAAKNLHVFDTTPADITLYADPGHFDFVVRNLMSNAIKFTEDNGSINLHAFETPLQQSIVFSIADSGAGMSENQLRQFTDDIRMDTTFGTKGEKGTGLGLMLCREFIQANNGKIWVESEPDTGTTFYFSLPVNGRHQ